MKKYTLLTAILLFITINISCSKSKIEQKERYSLVNPIIGTDFVGNTFPGATTPFGMVQLSPDNGLPGWDRIAGYFYPDSTINGFSHTHLQGTGAGDLYDISFMPATEPLLIAEPPLDVYAKFNHKTETMHAGYYAVTLEPYKIRVELTATPRCGIQRYSFNQSEGMIRLNLSKAMNWDRTLKAHIEVEDSCTISGYRFSDGWARNQKVYFATRFSTPFKNYKINTTQLPNDSIAEDAVFNFSNLNAPITIVTAISGVSIDGAKKNLAKEAPHNDFETYLNDAQNLWDKTLNKIQVKLNNNAEDTIFYTALYRAGSCPTLFSDVDGHYLGPDQIIHKTNGWENYSTFSLWDTYRAAHPLYVLTHPKEASDMIESLLSFGEQNHGHLPVWNMYASETDMMIGYHSIPVIVEAWSKGIYQGDEERMAKLFRTTAERIGYRGLDDYRTLGYVPYEEENESLSKTLEYVYDDSAIAFFAQNAGYEKTKDKQLESDFKKRANYYTNIFDKQSGFFRPRNRDGKWIEDFNPFAYTKHITESNAWQYLFAIQHDPSEFIKLMGKENAERQLDNLFNAQTPDSVALPIFSTGMIGQYVHGNEPSHHFIYYYNYLNQPWKTARLARKILKQFYTNEPNGLCGNEDCGQMSAWYVFNAIGFYPLDPVRGEYELASPIFEEVAIPQTNGKIFRILAPNTSEENCFIKSVKVNGKTYKKHFITYEQIKNGATIELEMTDQPGICWYL